MDGINVLSLCISLAKDLHQEKYEDHVTKPVPRSILKKATVEAEIPTVGQRTPTQEPRQESPNTKRKNRMKNIYKRILRPGSRAEHLLIQNGENSERIFLQMRAKSAARRHWDQKLKTDEYEKRDLHPQQNIDPGMICPCPAKEEIIPTEKEISHSINDDVTEGDLFVYDDFEDDEPSSDETVTLLPVNRQTVKTWEVGLDKTTICYRLGTAPRSKPINSNSVSPTLDVISPPVPGRVITTPVKSPPSSSVAKKLISTFNNQQSRAKKKGPSGNGPTYSGGHHGKWSHNGASYIVDDKWALTPGSPKSGKNVTFDTSKAESGKRLKRRSGMRKASLNHKDNQLRTSELLNHLENLPMLRKFKT